MSTTSFDDKSDGVYSESSSVTVLAGGSSENDDSDKDDSDKDDGDDDYKNDKYESDDTVHSEKSVAEVVEKSNKKVDLFLPRCDDSSQQEVGVLDNENIITNEEASDTEDEEEDDNDDNFFKSMIKDHERNAVKHVAAKNVGLCSFSHQIKRLMI